MLQLMKRLHSSRHNEMSLLSEMIQEAFGIAFQNFRKEFQFKNSIIYFNIVKYAIN